jgi:signal transduction histidine kinase
MIAYIRKLATRNMKYIPNFFERKRTLTFAHYNYALIGKLSASLLHDILTPITALSIGTSVTDEDTRRELSPIVGQSAKQIREFVEIMRQFLHECDTSRTVHFNEEIRKSIRLMSHKAIQHDVQIQFLELDQVHSLAHPLHVYQIIVNLVSNAIDASTQSQNRKVILIIKKQDKWFTIDCKDFGPGIPSDVRKGMYRPGFTTKHDGHGFGLYSVKSIVTRSLGGELSVHSEPGEGSLFSCRLPLRE